MHTMINDLCCFIVLSLHWVLLENTGPLSPVHIYKCYNGALGREMYTGQTLRLLYDGVGQGENTLILSQQNKKECI